MDINELVQKVKDGEEDALKAYIYLSKLEKDAKAAKDSIVDDALEVRSTYPEKALSISGAIVEVRSTATQYKYDHIPEYGVIKERLKSVEENAKQALIQQQKGSELVIDGEVITPAKAVLGKTQLFVKIKKDEGKDS